MLKRQDSLLSTSYLRTPPLPPPPPPKTTDNGHAKLTGCFPSIFKLISSKYHNRKKLITFGKKLKSTRNSVSVQTSETGVVQVSDASTDRVVKEETNNDQKKEDRYLESRKLLTSEVTPRSPTLRQEIRLPNHDVAGSFTESVMPEPDRPALVARLMGLEDQAVSRSSEKYQKEYIISNNDEEKRRQLLQALEKCNEDLVSLKKIIMAVQLVEDKHNKKSAPSEVFQPRPSDSNGDDNDGGDEVEGISRSPPWRRYNYTPKLQYNGVMPHQQQIKKPPAKKPGEEDGLGISFIDKVQAESLKMRRKATNPNVWSSKAMIQSVEEVCNDIVCGEKRELQNLELALDSYISRELIEEVVFDLGFNRNRMQVRLPFEACRRRISF